MINVKSTVILIGILLFSFQFFAQSELVLESDTISRTRLRFVNNNGNFAVGLGTLNDNNTGFSNIALGYNSLAENTDGFYNIGIGDRTLENNKLGFHNIAIGTDSQRSNSFGVSNLSLGWGSLDSNLSGSDNISLGELSLYDMLSGNDNIALGNRSLISNISGSDNVAIGRRALFENLVGTSNVAIGSSAGYSETGSNKLYIENSDAGNSEALIYGEFDNDVLRINGKVGVESAVGSYMLKVKQTGVYGLDIENEDENDWEFYVAFGGNLNLYGDGNGLGMFDIVTGAYSSTSDITLKENIIPADNVLDRVMKLGSAKSYTYKNDKNKKLQLGFIAQELSLVFPEFVSAPNSIEKRNQIYTVNYAGLSSVAISAIVEQQGLIEAQKQKIEHQESIIKMILSKIESLEKIISE